MAAPCGRSALPLVLIALSAAFLTYNALLSTRSFPPLPSASLPGDAATTAFPSSSRRVAAGGSGGGGPRLFHTAVTASGSVYNTWQCRVMYHWFKEARRQARGAEMGGFTRILHSGKPDEFVHEIPTFVAEPLPAGADQVIPCARLLGFVKNCNFTSYHPLSGSFLLLPWFVVTGSGEMWVSIR
jgi:hypothetical protein